jgi:hypothetical protein
MKKLIICAAVIGSVAGGPAANAKGCLKGAVIGGVAGHVAGHHGLLGAAAGCIIGRHEAKKRNQIQTNDQNQTRPKLRPGEERF